MHNGGGMNRLFVPVVLLLNDAMLFWNASLWLLTFDPNIKAAVVQLLKKIKKILKLTVTTGQVMFSGEIYYYWPQIQLTKSLENIVVFFCIYA